MSESKWNPVVEDGVARACDEGKRRMREEVSALLQQIDVELEEERAEWLN